MWKGLDRCGQYGREAGRVYGQEFDGAAAAESGFPHPFQMLLTKLAAREAEHLARLAGHLFDPILGIENLAAGRLRTELCQVTMGQRMRADFEVRTQVAYLGRG